MNHYQITFKCNFVFQIRVLSSNFIFCLIIKCKICSIHKIIPFINLLFLLINWFRFAYLQWITYTFGWNMQMQSHYQEKRTTKQNDDTIRDMSVGENQHGCRDSIHMTTNSKVVYQRVTRTLAWYYRARYRDEHQPTTYFLLLEGLICTEHPYLVHPIRVLFLLISHF